MSDTWEPVYGLSNDRTGVDPRALYQNDQGLWEEPAPIECPHGHALDRGRTVGYISCPVNGRGGHRTDACDICWDAGEGNDTIYTPPLDEHCVCGTARPAGASNSA